MKKLFEKRYVDDERLYPTRLFYALERHVAFNAKRLGKQYPGKSALEIIEILAKQP